jgi:hypothetical protein
MKRPLGYLDGFGTGIAVLALVGVAWLAAASPHFAEMYRSMNPAAVTGATKLVLSSTWYIGAPAALVTALIAAHIWRPRYALIAIAILTIAVDVFWYLAAYAPIMALAGNIR